MKRFSPALLLILNGCFSCGTGSHVQPVDEALKVYRPAVPPLSDRHASDALDRVAAGTWVRYQAAKDGNETTFTVGAVRGDRDSLWIEVVEEGDPRKASLRRVAFDGTVLSARFQEIPASGPASEVADQPIFPAAESVPPPPAEVREERRTLKVGARETDAVIFRRVFRDEALGREYEVEDAWSKDVPPLFEHLEDAGALVYRASRGESIRLLGWGTGYTPSIR